MLRLSLLPLVAALATSGSAFARAYSEVEACFVLDTTGSMSAMIETAKEKVWFIANQIVNARSRPGLKLCLTAYRDRGDEYITRRLDLTDDIDDFYQHLSELKAAGGGDTPESVNQALLETVTLTSWGQQPDTLRVIFLIGDAPPHTDYDEPQYKDIAQLAWNRQIVINPVLVGSHAAARAIWQDIAATAEGENLRIAAPDTSRVSSTPVDQDLIALNSRMGRLIVPYGQPAVRDAVLAKQDRSEDLSDAALADRLSFNLRTGRVVQGSGDLIHDMDSGLVTADAINADWLPEGMRSMTEAELLLRLGQIRAERQEIQALVASLLDERRVLLDKQRPGEGFEHLVSQVIVQQMSRSDHP
ncbi:MAG: vWA domain-containing protein [Xanthomonadales bacterium]|nr:vWA domain-containing protein [Xanthomonadales bacterium]